ncbi:hypothetical protein Hesp01_73310 [Herbidospora sp. NBRC 101105]|nr:hypothetical protein Hesp01_73310 [Herbidospora sp. NBRC 101105]
MQRMISCEVQGSERRPRVAQAREIRRHAFYDNEIVIDSRHTRVITPSRAATPGSQRSVCAPMTDSTWSFS